jgi:predicted lipoprotein with Yx(FWY)xxD motif
MFTGSKFTALKFNRMDRPISAWVFALLIAAGFIMLSAISPASLAAEPESNSPAPERLDAAATLAIDKLPYPSEVSVIHRPKGWLLRASPSNKRLYVYDRDTPEKSACTGNCSEEWPPLTTGADTKPLGDWTIFVRDDGTRQWAYKGHQVYIRSRDSAGKPAGDGIGGAWHYLVP